MYGVTSDQLQQAQHPNPDAAIRRRFVSEEERDRWLSMVRQRISQFEAARIARGIAERHGEEID